MKIGAVKNIYSFGAIKAIKSKQDEQSNPISKNGEKALLVKGTFLAGLGFGAKLLFELMDCDFVVEKLGNKASQIVDKQQRNVSNNKKNLLKFGAWLGLVAMFIGGAAVLYTLFKAPKINYDGNVNAFKKGKDMDVYIKGNNVEKELYTQMNEKAKNAAPDEKAKLKEQYILMQMAKNRVPDFIKL